jgi:hypothetical protein
MHYLYVGNERIISMLDWFPFAAAHASESGRWRLPIIQLFNFLSDRHRGTNRNSPICDRPSWPSDVDRRHDQLGNFQRHL